MTDDIFDVSQSGNVPFWLKDTRKIWKLGFVVSLALILVALLLQYRFCSRRVVQTREVATQSQTTYRRDLQTPRFQVLSEWEQGTYP